MQCLYLILGRRRGGVNPLSSSDDIWKNVYKKKKSSTKTGAYDYGVLDTIYCGGTAFSTGKYFKISFPFPAGTYRMGLIEGTLTYDFSNGLFAKYFIRFYVGRANNVETAVCHVLSPVETTVTEAPVYFVPPGEIWIKNPTSYSSFSINSIILQDNIASTVDLTKAETYLSLQSTLPSSEVTSFTMKRIGE